MIVGRIDVRQRRLGDLAAERLPRIDVARDLRGAAFDQMIGHDVPLLGDDPRNAEEPALPLRRCASTTSRSRHGVRASSRSTLRDSTTCAVAGTAEVELCQRIDVLEQIVELRAEALDLFVGQRDARQLGDVADVDLLG